MPRFPAVKFTSAFYFSLAGLYLEIWALDVRPISSNTIPCEFMKSGFFYQYEGYGIGCYTYFCTCQHNGMKGTPICHLSSRFTIDKSLKIPSVANVVVFQNISYRKGNHSVNAGSGVLQTSLEPLNSVAQQGCSLFLLPHGVLLLV